MDEFITIMSEVEWRLIEQAAMLQERADWMGAELCRQQAGYDLLKLNRSEV
jgi:hypothetical protein